MNFRARVSSGGKGRMGILTRARRSGRPSNIEIEQALALLVPAVRIPADEELRETWTRENTEVAARHIHFRVTPSDTPAYKESRHTLAEQVRESAAKGEDFVDLAQKFTTEPGGKERSGDLGRFRRGRMVPPFEDAAFALQPGEISEVVETVFGFHVIRVEDRREVEIGDIEVLRQAYLERARKTAVREYIERLKTEAGVEVQNGAEKWVRRLAKRPNSIMWRLRANHTLVSYRGGTVTVGDMTEILQEPNNARHLPQITTAEDASLRAFLSDQAGRNLVWTAASRSLRSGDTTFALTPSR